jgi:SAM-dependent methyltransferase
VRPYFECDFKMTATSAASSTPDLPYCARPVKGEDIGTRPLQATPTSRRLVFGKANAARVYDCLLGGKNNFQADRDMAAKLLKHTPGLDRCAHDNHAFRYRVVEYLAHRGYRNFLDLGCGFPSELSVHDIACRIQSEAQVVYVDNDPLVAIHGRALLSRKTRTTMLEADVRKLDDLHAAPQIQEMLRSGEPIAVLALGLFETIPAHDHLDGILAGIRDICTPGGVLAFSHLTGEDGKTATIEHGLAGSCASMTLRSQEELLAQFHGRWSFEEPGLVDVRQWSREALDTAERLRTVRYVGGLLYPVDTAR